MRWTFPIVAIGVLAWACCSSALADDPNLLPLPPTPGEPDAALVPGELEEDVDATYVPIFPDSVPARERRHWPSDREFVEWMFGGDPADMPGFGQQPVGYDPRMVARFGWWQTETMGDLTKVGEYQDLSPSAFWDVDRLHSNGRQTLGFSLTGTDAEANFANLLYYDPNLSVDIDYNRFLRLLDHDPLDNFRSPPADPSAVSVLDSNFGETYATRVQTLKTSFKGRLTNHLRWRLNVRGFRRSGERQANSTAHCFHPGNFSSFTCHTVSQRQQIDWLTSEIEPVIEGRFGLLGVEYSRTMRSFDQSDQLVTRPDGTTLVGFPGQSDVDYGVVPENLTQIDRVQLNASLPMDSHFYANMFVGNTKNESRNINRRYHGFDVRMTQQPNPGLKLTGYAKLVDTDGEKPSTLVPGETGFDQIRDPVDRRQTTVGLKGRWRLHQRQCWTQGLSVTAGYEYRFLDRENVAYDLVGAPGTFYQPDTNTNLLHAGATMRYSANFDTFVRYRMAFHDFPLLAVANQNNVSLDSALNSSLPTQEHLVEIGGTWIPSHYFVLTATAGVDHSLHSSEYTDSTQNRYPIAVTASVNPSPRWSLTAGYANISNWIDQEITLGDRNNPFSSLWNFGGRSNVMSLGCRYAWNRYLRLQGGAVFVRSQNLFATPPSPNPGVVDYSDLPVLSDVLVETVKLTAGFDCRLNDWSSYYLYYNYFDYEDESRDYNSGTAAMFLGGFSATF